MWAKSLGEFCCAGARGLEKVGPQQRTPTFLQLTAPPCPTQSKNPSGFLGAKSKVGVTSGELQSIHVNHRPREHQAPGGCRHPLDTRRLLASDFDAFKAVDFAISICLALLGFSQPGHVSPSVQKDPSVNTPQNHKQKHVTSHTTQIVEIRLVLSIKQLSRNTSTRSEKRSRGGRPALRLLASLSLRIRKSRSRKPYNPKFRLPPPLLSKNIENAMRATTPKVTDLAIYAIPPCHATSPGVPSALPCNAMIPDPSHPLLLRLPPIYANPK